MILAVYGSGGLGREIYELANRSNAIAKRWHRIVFIDDFRPEGAYYGTATFPFSFLIENKENCECIVAVGEPLDREKLYMKLKVDGVEIATLIDPSVILSPTAKVGSGSIICEYVTIHSGVEIGINALVQPFCDIGHDIKIGDHSILSPFCAPGGGVVIGDRVFIGMHATLLQGLTVGDNSIVGMGSVVFRDVPAGATVLGNPARVTRGNEDHKVFK